MCSLGVDIFKIILFNLTDTFLSISQFSHVTLLLIGPMRSEYKC